MFTIYNLLSQAMSLHKQDMEASKDRAKVSSATADKANEEGAEKRCREGKQITNQEPRRVK